MGKVLGCLGIALICGLIGLVPGFLVGVNTSRGYFQQWETIALPEGLHPVEFITDDVPIAYLQTEEGQLLAHDCMGWMLDKATSWQPATEAITITAAAAMGHRYYDHCQSEQPYQPWPTAAKPQSAVRAQMNCPYVIGAEMITHCRYILLEDGTTQIWENGASALTEPAMGLEYAINFALGGALIGGLIFVFIAAAADKRG